MSDLNPGIAKTVAWLNAMGFATCDSGDGETHDFECDRPYPYVVISVSPADLVAETHRLMVSLSAFGIEVKPLGPENSGPHIEAIYLPATGTAFIELHHVKDEVLV